MIIQTLLIAGGYGCGKENALLSLIKHEPDIEKIYLYATDPYETEYNLLINKTENTSTKYFNESTSFIESSNKIDKECKRNK